MTPSTVFDQILKKTIQDDELINLYFSEYRGTFDTIEDTVIFTPAMQTITH
jgi:hypothetical protein